MDSLFFIKKRWFTPSPDKSPDLVGAGTGRRRGVKGLRKNLLTQRPDRVEVKAR